MKFKNITFTPSTGARNKGRFTIRKHILYLSLKLLMGCSLLVSFTGHGQTYDKIINKKPPRPTPWVINGCEIKPKTVCPNADLRFADLSQANLSGADLRGAKLTRADLRGANLIRADLSGADLEAADMRISLLKHTKFIGANLRSANFEFARAMQADMSYADLTASNFEAAKIYRIQMIGAKIINANFQEAKLYQANLSHAIMKNTIIKFAIFQDAFMEGCLGCPHDW